MCKYCAITFLLYRDCRMTSIKVLFGENNYFEARIRNSLKKEIKMQNNSLLRLLIVTLQFCFHIFSYAQTEIPIGTFRTHLSFNSASHVAVGESSAYCTTLSGIFTYDFEDNSLKKLLPLMGSAIQISSRWVTVLKKACYLLVISVETLM